MLASEAFKQGRRYWEITCETIEGHTSIYIGICKEQSPVTLPELQNTYGLLIPECKKFSRKPDDSRYQMEQFVTHSIRNGDRVGVLLEFSDENQTASLSFFKNGSLLGRAFSGLEPGEYYPCLSVNYGTNVSTLNSSARVPSEPYKKADEGDGHNPSHNEDYGEEMEEEDME